MSFADAERDYAREQLTRAPAPNDHPRWARRFGIFELTHRQLRASWAEITWDSLGLGLELNAYGERTHLMVRLPFFWAFIYLPLLNGFSVDDVNGQPSYGFNWAWGRGGACHVHWGRRVKIIEAFWGYHGVGNEFLAADGRWLDRDQRARSWAPGEGVEPLEQVFPYHYMLDEGEVQHVDATVICTRHKVVWQWFGYGRLSKALRRLQSGFVPFRYTIDIAFSEEVGGRRGSWKGGCVGCAYEMKPGETPRAALLRMQRERRFR